MAEYKVKNALWFVRLDIFEVMVASGDLGLHTVGEACHPRTEM